MAEVGEFTRKAEELLAMVGEMELAGDLLDAARRLRAVSAEHDDVDARFHATADEVKRLLLQRIELIDLTVFLRERQPEVKREGLRLLPPPDEDKEVPF